MAPKKHALFVGDSAHELARPMVQWLGQRYTLCCESDFAAACRACRECFPTLIVVSQTRPGQFGRDEIEQLHGEAPLARLVGLMGEWCEGETRTGSPWPGVARVYWHQFSARAASRGTGPDALASPLPRTATDVERLLASSPIQVSHPALVLVRTADSVTFEVISESLLESGLAAVRVCGDQRAEAAGVGIGVWDCAASVSEDCDRLRCFAERLSPAPVIAIVGFPRRADLQDAMKCGAAAVLGKPFLVEDLISEITGLCRVNSRFPDTESVGAKTA